MTNKVKEYLREHADELEDLVSFFYNLGATTQLENGDIYQLCGYLIHAGIDFEEERLEALNMITSEHIEEFAEDNDPSIEAIPIIDFIAALFNNFLGLTTGKIRDYMLEHAEQWDNLVELYIDEINIPIIKRR